MSDKTTKIEPRSLQGFMELSPSRQVLFNRVQDTIRAAYERFGFLPLDTPVLEYASVLLAKAGGETEKQMYRFTKGDTDMVMRFDLTVPLAKYVAKNYNELNFPFRRYQIGKVYRGERPQKGRFREFYQCDIDVVGDGKLSLQADAEIPGIIYTVFKKLGFDRFKIRISNRKILAGFLDGLRLSEKASEISGVIDKYKKVGGEKVRGDLIALGISAKSTDAIMDFIAFDGMADIQIKRLSGFSSGALFSEGVAELSEVIQGIRMFGVPEDNFTVDLKIVRGLDYYTGTVYETFLDEFENIGSVCSGGRYENLAGFYTDKKLPGVGISIGLTRLFDKLCEVMEQKSGAVSTVLVLSPDGETEACIKTASILRERGINTEVYLEEAKIKSKFKYADRLGIPFVIIIGASEREMNKVTLKNMMTGEQNSVTIEDVISAIGYHG